MKLTLCIFVVLVSTQLVYAVPGSGKLARELIEQMTRKYGDDAARQIADFGGEKAVRESLERAVREGGEELAKKLNQAAYTHGMSAFRALSKNPRVFLNALDKIPPSLTKQAVYAIERNPDEIAELIVKLGPDALEVAARHPGVGNVALKKLGEGAIPLARNLPEAQFMKASRYMDDIANLPEAARKTTLETLAKYPAKALEFFDNKPNILKYGSGVAVAIVYKDGIIKTVQEGQTQLIEIIRNLLGLGRDKNGNPVPNEGMKWLVPAVFIILALGLAGSWIVRAKSKEHREGED